MHKRAYSEDVWSFSYLCRKNDQNPAIAIMLWLFLFNERLSQYWGLKWAGCLFFFKSMGLVTMYFKSVGLVIRYFKSVGLVTRYSILSPWDWFSRKCEWVGMEERKILFKTYQYCKTVPAQSLTLSLPTVEVTFKSYTKISRPCISSLKSTMPKNYVSKWPVWGLLFC
jgi:hypothetical protein